MLYDFLMANISRFFGAEWDAIETAMVADGFCFLCDEFK